MLPVATAWVTVIAMGVCALCAQSSRAAASTEPIVPSASATAVLRREEDEPVSDGSTNNASYTRYSSDLQSTRSTDDQRRKCRDAARRDGLEICSDLEFGDEAISGAKRNRPGFEELMTAARAGRIQNLYFESLSRLARDCVLTLQTLKGTSAPLQSADRQHRRRHRQCYQ
jgi:hypothetical protein